MRSTHHPYRRTHLPTTRSPYESISPSSLCSSYIDAKRSTARGDDDDSCSRALFSFISRVHGKEQRSGLLFRAEQLLLTTLLVIQTFATSMLNHFVCAGTSVYQECRQLCVAARGFAQRLAAHPTSQRVASKARGAWASLKGYPYSTRAQDFFNSTACEMVAVAASGILLGSLSILLFNALCGPGPACAAVAGPLHAASLAPAALRSFALSAAEQAEALASWTATAALTLQDRTLDAICSSRRGPSSCPANAATPPPPPPPPGDEPHIVTVDMVRMMATPHRLFSLRATAADGCALLVTAARFC